ncbi:MAG: radical SAM family heme chaperone HemW [Ruminococcaceae bacterium]|nr:radical SAM family heme chaperone HemW [Oscillospiraceae bacterium]
MMKKGVYIHIPFCQTKCPYCDFYSMRGTDEKKDMYLDALNKEIFSHENISADTIYLGGGTPSVFGKDRLKTLIENAKKQFHFSEGEITVEVNPSSCDEELIETLASVGVNRISMGLQSAIDSERKILGRHSNTEKVKKSIDLCQKNGIVNISLDVMLGVPEQTKESLEKTLEFVVNSGAKHVSAYILKIEENTLFFRRQNTLPLPDEDAVCDMYEFTCDYLEKAGFRQYEISNFSKENHESKHNLKYWNSEEYLGIGPAAHSYLDGKRFYHDRNFEKYLKNPTEYIPDGDGGSFEEYAMLKLRLTKGLSLRDVSENFSKENFENILKNSEKFIRMKLMNSDGENLYFTRQGFLLSNTILSEII